MENRSTHKKLYATSLMVAIMGCSFTLPALAAHHGEKSSAQACQGFGPQTPRDIDNLAGTNKRVFSMAPSYEDMNLCNIHFHKNAEHKAKDFAIKAAITGDEKTAGYQCAISQTLSKSELKKPKGDVCNGLKPGDTIEVHWVHSSCDVKPGPGLGSCLSSSCANPDLRVETQVFTLVNDKKALDFATLDYSGQANANGLHQAKAIPNNTGAPVEFLGSTTGPSFNEQQCSPLQVSWSVRPQCAKVDINSVAQWCKSNAFNEDHAHGVRELVKNPALLSEIK